MTDDRDCRDPDAAWREIKRTTRPLKRRGTRSAQTSDAPLIEKPLETPPRARGKTPSAPPSEKGASSVPKNATPASPAVATLSRKDKRRLARAGQLPTLDLHGMRQHEAFSALERFLRQAFAQQHRDVLVITGKGRNSRLSFLASGLGIGRPETLKNLVPQWISLHFSAYVGHYSPAPRGLGDSGALVLRIRRNRQGHTV